MPAISVLDKSVYELIAAGEVIEKPASVIKEVIENSIDAGAKHITIEIKHGGIEFMRVADDGCGMSREDVPIAFLRHATSKINEKDDLDKIMTLGFRGEALASVAAVSKVSILTKRKNDEMGTAYTIEGSVEKSIENAGCPDGTTIIIRELFYNVPARKKFLKKEVTEANAISFIVRKVALSHPDISFKLIRDNRMEFCSSGDGNLKSAMYAVYGKDFANDMIPVNYETEKVKVTGYTVKPLYSKSNRSFQNFFVDKRYVSSKLCSAALESAYENLVMVGKFPACVIELSMPPTMLDVNIHPTKAQVRFSDEKAVSDAVYFAIKNALMQSNLIYDFQIPKAVPSIQWKDNSVGKNTDFETLKIDENTEKKEEIELNVLNKIKKAEAEKTDENDVIVDIPDTYEKKIIQEEKSNNNVTVQKFSSEESVLKAEKNEISDEKTEKNEKKFSYNIETGQIEEEKSEDIPKTYENDIEENFSQCESNDIENIDIPQEIKEETEKNIPEKTEEPIQSQIKKTEKDIVVLGEAFKNYILAQADNNLIIIDKHAAHERVLFEKLKKGVGKLDQQYLLTPVEMLLNVSEFDALYENSEKLIDLGFVFNFDNKPFVKLEAVPSFVSELDFDEIITEIARNFMTNKHNPQTHYLDDMLHTMACKAAIKANDNNLTEELQYLTDEIFADNTIRHCPHGRPVMFKISKYELEKQFKRTGV